MRFSIADDHDGAILEASGSEDAGDALAGPGESNGDFDKRGHLSRAEPAKPQLSIGERGREEPNRPVRSKGG